MGGNILFSTSSSSNSLYWPNCNAIILGGSTSGSWIQGNVSSTDHTGTGRLAGLDTPQYAHDAANKEYVDSMAGNYRSGTLEFSTTGNCTGFNLLYTQWGRIKTIDATFRANAASGYFAFQFPDICDCLVANSALNTSVNSSPLLCGTTISNNTCYIWFDGAKSGSNYVVHAIGFGAQY